MEKKCFSLFQRGNQTRTAAYLGNYNNEEIIYQTPWDRVKAEGKVITISLNTSCKNESSILRAKLEKLIQNLKHKVKKQKNG